MERLPLFSGSTDGDLIVDADGIMTRPELLHSARRLADQLPNKRNVIVLAGTRKAFLLCFVAALLREQTLLLPANNSAGAVDDLVNSYPDCYTITEQDGSIRIDGAELRAMRLNGGMNDDNPGIRADHVAAIVQTSGSTGVPQSHEKTWADMVATAERWRRRFSFDDSDFIVATVPTQHMYGFETSVLLPLQTGASVFNGQPLFPADIAAALNIRANQGTLITTPIHLRVNEKSETGWPTLRRIISSTAALDAQLARDCEAVMRAPLIEVFGSTETNAFASRSPTREDHWTCFDGLQLSHHGDSVSLCDTAAGRVIPIYDEVRIGNEGTFKFLGRPSDMIKIAGKRASLADLNLRLTRIEGVRDGVLLQSLGMPGTSGIQRLIAVVVAPGISDRRIREELANQIDPVFLPRRIHHVDELPRNATGKISVSAAQTLLARLSAE